jgi:hypothetical protein
MRSKLLQGAGFLMPKANRVHCTQRRTASKIQWASLMQSITSDMIRAGSKNGIGIGFMGVIGSALATVLPKAEPIVPIKAPGCHWEFHGGAIGISESLYVFDAGVAAGYAGGFARR